MLGFLQRTHYNPLMSFTFVFLYPLFWPPENKRNAVWFVVLGHRHREIPRPVDCQLLNKCFLASNTSPPTVIGKKSVSLSIGGAC